MISYEGKTREELLEEIQKLKTEISKIREREQAISSYDQNKIGIQVLKAILDNIPLYLYVKDTDDDFRYLYLNSAFSDYIGMPAEMIIGQNDLEILENKEMGERFRRDDMEALHQGYTEYDEEVKMGNELRTLGTIKTIICSENRSYLVGVSWDMTEVRLAEKRLIEARIKAEEADKLKSSFLANMSHEIRTPLNAIVNFSRLVAETKEEEEKRAYVDIVDKNSKMLLSLFNDILDLSAIESGALVLSFRPVTLYDLCLRQYDMHKNTTQSGVKLVLNSADQELWITTDWTRLGQVFENLLSNAIKFTRNGEIHFGFERHGEVVQFYVKDTGIGISASKIGTIFKRFGKVNNFVQGSGLGLTLSRMLVEQMGGRIWARSNLGIGTTFYFTLPFVQTV